MLFMQGLGYDLEMNSLSQPQSRQEVLIEANLKDLYRAFAVPRRWQLLAKMLFYSSAQKLAQKMLTFDQEIALYGLQIAAKHLLAHYAESVQLTGATLLPSGKLIVAMNHPGLTDILVLLSHFARQDLRIIAAERKLLRALPNLSKYLIFLNESTQLRLSTIREVKRHLENDGCLILFPKGGIEADPHIDSVAAIESLASWQTSLTTFASLSDQIKFQAAIIKGVRHPKSFKNPLLHLRKDPKERDWLAATFQLLQKQYQNYPIELTVTDSFQTSEGVLAAAKKIMS